jgi:hypothetical protein
MALEPNSVAAALADYILALRDAARITTRAEDRGIYSTLLADGGILLAMATRGEPVSGLIAAAAKHERLWGHTWLQDGAYQAPLQQWQAAKGRISGSAI